MSLQAITSALSLRGYAASEKLLLIALANYADEFGRCFPSQRRLSEDTGLSDRQIRTIAANLEGRGCISRQERRRPDGSRSTDIVTLICLVQAEATSGGVGKPLPGGGEATSGQNLSLNPSGSKEPKRSSKRVPESWRPELGDLEEALADGMTQPEIDRSLRTFRDHTFAAPRSDWSATFRNWLRKDLDRKPKNDRSDRTGSSPKLDKLGRIAAAMAASVERTEGEHSGDRGEPPATGGSVVYLQPSRGVG